MPSNQDKIKELERWVEDFIPSKKDFEKAVLGSKKLSIYLGIDPTSPQLHLGHSTNFFLLKKLQDMGHKITLLIGDFTARIGDPSGRTKERVPLSVKEIKENFALYKEQANKILDFNSKNNPVKVSYNSKWFKDFTTEQLVGVASQFTVQQMLVREMFQKRIKDKNPVGLHEFLYPLLQGYDSVVLETDMEVGGNDQLFNMLIGRDLVKKYLNKEKLVVTTRLLINLKTGSKLMSKSEGGYIGLNDESYDMYGKVMALPDEVVKDCFKLCTEVPISEIDDIVKKPMREAKARLAREITSIYHSKALAEKAEKDFNSIFLKGELPSDIPAKKINKSRVNIAELLLEVGLVESKSEARRVVEQGGVKIDGEAVSDWAQNIEVKSGMIIRVGKWKFVKLVK